MSKSRIWREETEAATVAEYLVKDLLATAAAHLEIRGCTEL